MATFSQNRPALLLVFTFFVTTVLSNAQSTETFNTVRFEDPSSIGSFVALQPPSGISPYSLTLPASLAVGSWGPKINGSSGLISWGAYYNWLGSNNQLVFFKGTDSIRGSASFMYDDSQGMLSISNSSAITANDTVVKISNTATSSTASVSKATLNIAATGTLSGATTTNSGIIVDASGAATNNAATFNSGRVGIGTSTPNTTLDVTEDIAFRELNYTTALSGTNNDLAFNTGNKGAFIRLGGSSTAKFSVTGLSGGVSGKYVTIFNTTGQTMTLKNENAGSVGANRIWTYSQSDFVIGHRGAVTMIYGGTDSRWIVVSAVGTVGQSDRQTAKTVTNSDKLIPSANNNYVRVTNNSGEISPTFEAGSFVGQFLVIQNDGPQNLKIVNTSNLKCNGGETSLGQRDMAMFIWDGTYWYQISSDSDN